MKHPLFFTSIAALLLMSSCDKPQVLLRQRAVVEAEVLRTNEEMRNIDAKTQALMSAPIAYGMTLDHYHEQSVKKNAALEEEVAKLEKKSTAVEAALSELRPRLDAYKAKYLR